VLERYDIIGIDPRFVGASTPLTCGLGAQDATQTTPPLEQRRGFEATAAFMKKVAEACDTTSKRFLPGLYFDGNFPGLAELWQQINEAPSNVTELTLSRSAAALVEVPVDNAAMSGLAILCDDVAWSRDVQRHRRERETDRRKHPMSGTLGSNIWACAFWPTNSVEPPVTIHASGPQNILLLQNLRDPVTPLQGGYGMRDALGDRARLITADQGGHVRCPQ